MVNEAILRTRLADPIDFTVADGTGIEKGALLKLTDPRTAILSDGSGDVIAGIAARDKIASDGRTQLAVFRKGIFDMVASGAITTGAKVVSGLTGSLNFVSAAGDAADSGAVIIGHALEDAANTETAQIWVNL
tara:strand:- start:257 stop:655 length:399 start_codon:yes stop_codon:yes gene_type:complete